MTNTEIDSLISNANTNLGLINARLAEVMASVSPSYSIDGHTISTNEYQEMLLRNQKTQLEVIAGLQKMKNLFNPYGFRSSIR